MSDWTNQFIGYQKMFHQLAYITINAVRLLDIFTIPVAIAFEHSEGKNPNFLPGDELIELVN
jgi:hypothetical protein